MLDNTFHHIVKSFTELGPWLLRLPGVEYLLSEVFSQDNLERYFSYQHHPGGSNENPTAYQVPYNAATLVQQRFMYNDLKSMNVEVDQQDNRLHQASQIHNPSTYAQGIIKNKHVTIQARYKNITFPLEELHMYSHLRTGIVQRSKYTELECLARDSRCNDCFTLK